MPVPRAWSARSRFGDEALSRLRHAGPLLALGLLASAAVASLFGPAAVGRITGSIPFITIAALLGVLACWVGGTRLFRHSTRNPVAAVIHLGLALGIASVGADRAWSGSGYLYLESGAPAENFYLRRDLRSTNVFGCPVALDSLRCSTARGFRPAPVAFLSDADGSSLGPVTYNRPLRLGATELVFLRSVEPGFLREYELAVADEGYVLLHNQHVRLPDGSDLWSFAADPARHAVGLAVGSDTAWLEPGVARSLGPARLELAHAAFSTRPGALFAVRDTRWHLPLFAGFGLALLGLLLSALRRRQA